MGLAKQLMLDQHWEEMGLSELRWSQVQAVLEFLMLEFPNTVTWKVQDEIKDRRGDGLCGVDWSSIRQMLNNLTDIYFSDLLLHDLYGQIVHMSDRYDSLGAKAEEARDHSDDW